MTGPVRVAVAILAEAFRASAKRMLILNRGDRDQSISVIVFKGPQLADSFAEWDRSGRKYGMTDYAMGLEKALERAEAQAVKLHERTIRYANEAGQLRRQMHAAVERADFFETEASGSTHPSNEGETVKRLRRYNRQLAASVRRLQGQRRTHDASEQVGVHPIDHEDPIKAWDEWYRRNDQGWSEVGDIESELDRDSLSQ